MAPQRGSAARTLTVALMAVIGVALVVRTYLPLDLGYVIKASAAFGVILLVTRRSLRAHHPLEEFGLANQITSLRAVLVALLIGLIGGPDLPALARWAVTLSAVATVLDGVDGWLARRMGITSAFGARFDMETDALLTQVLSILAWQYGKAGPWVLASGLLRYLFVAAGWIWPWMAGPLPPTRRAKVTCVVQIATLVAILLPALTVPLTARLAGAALAVLCWSFLIDVLWLWRHRA